MLAQKQRLSRKEFSTFFKQGRRYQSPTATLIHTPSAHKFHGAVVVSKKVDKKAVTRNTLRRRVYAQLYRAFCGKKTGIYIVVLKPNFKNLTRTQQHQEIAKLIEQVK